MSFFNRENEPQQCGKRYPWTSFHELNLDWFLRKFKDLHGAMAEMTAVTIPVESTQDPFVEVTGGQSANDPFVLHFELPRAQDAAVTSVNGQTGAVVLDAADVGALPEGTHIPADTVVTPILTSGTRIATVNGTTLFAPSGGGGGGGAVDSVNGQTGDVVLDAADVGAVDSSKEAEINANTTARHSHINKTVLDGIGAVNIAAWNAKQDTLHAGDNISIENGTVSAVVPTVLPNPQALTINGTSYTGSSAVSMTIPVYNIQYGTIEDRPETAPVGTIYIVIEG